MRTQSKKLTCEFVTVTPKMADLFLRAAGKNRHLRENTVSLYAAMMKRGDWCPTNQGIGFDVRGKLIDGQHRLMAILKSDTPATILVVRGLSVGTQLVLDRPATRSIHDQISLDRGYVCTARHIAIAKAMYISVATSRTRQDSYMATKDVILMEKFYARYHRGIEFCIGLFNKEVVPGVTVTPAMAPIARAYYTIDDHEALRTFAEILTTGFGTSKEATSVIALRNFLLTGRESTRDRHSRINIYKKAELALRAYLDGEVLTRLPKTELEQELFLLPGEKPLSTPSEDTKPRPTGVRRHKEVSA